MSTISPISFTNAGLTGSLTGILAFTSQDLIQVFVSIPDTVNSFKFGVGGVVKHTLFGDQGAGFHLGGGLGLGTNGDFAMNILGVVGVHFAPNNSNVVFHLDGGPSFSLQKVSAGTTSNTVTSFGIGQYSNILGASVAYMF